jgi:hypothetical protein
VCLMYHLVIQTAEGTVQSFTGKQIIARKISKLLYEEVVASPGTLGHARTTFLQLSYCLSV